MHNSIEYYVLTLFISEKKEWRVKCANTFQSSSFKIAELKKNYQTDFSLAKGDKLDEKCRSREGVRMFS